MKTFADAEQVLAAALPGYESRPPQQALAAKVEELLATEAFFEPYTGPEEDYPEWVRPGLTHFLGQAGTGVGKSLGYLIPTILSGRRIVVSVTTKALQNQLATKDLPFLDEHLGLRFTWTVLKGRSNYLCVNRMALVTSSDVEDLPAITKMLHNDDFDGQRETVETTLGRPVPGPAWSLICSESEECYDAGCNPSTCFAERARAVARESRVVIVNHALFLTDLLIKTYGLPGMLDAYDAVIFDEAHELEEVAGSTLGAALSVGSFGSLTSQVHRWAREYGDEDAPDALVEPLGKVSAAAAALFDALPVSRLTEVEITAAGAELVGLYDALDALRDGLKAAKSDGSERGAKRKSSVYRILNSLRNRLVDVISAPQTEMVRWVEEERTRRGEVRRTIKIAPVLVAPFLFQHLFAKTPCVLVSATLAVKGSFGYITTRLGVGPAFDGLDVGTPFDYPEQGRIYVPVHLPEPKGADQTEWQVMATNEMSVLLRQSGGRALLLFTSVAHMREAHRMLTLMNPEISLRMQGEAPTGELTAWLKDHDPEAPRALLATKSFFTGVDIPGEALSLVVVAKMPFPRPGDALIDARCEAIEAAGGSAFSDYTIPVMSLVLQQAAGRLIRHREDRGVVAILDPRILSKGYGRQIMSDLPPMGRLTRSDEVGAFLAPA